ncbi:MAG: hypothetical protein Q8L88_06675 [Bacteroidota bacterium]|nr:hypothetical protein [Bacteroidota bacterium]
MYQFLFDTSVILGGIFLAIFGVIVLTSHKKSAWICLGISLFFFTISISTSWLKTFEVSENPTQKTNLQEGVIDIDSNTSQTIKIQPIEKNVKKYKPKSPPFVGASIERLEVNAKSDTAYTVRIMIQSSEKLALKLIVYGKLCIDSVTTKDSIQVRDSIKSYKDYSRSLPANLPHYALFSFPKFESIQDPFKTEKKFIFLGIISYYDGNDIRHFTTFCFYCKPNSEQHSSYPKFNNAF